MMDGESTSIIVPMRLFNSPYAAGWP